MAFGDGGLVGRTKVFPACGWSRWCESLGAEVVLDRQWHRPREGKGLTGGQAPRIDAVAHQPGPARR